MQLRRRTLLAAIVGAPLAPAAARTLARPAPPPVPDIQIPHRETKAEGAVGRWYPRQFLERHLCGPWWHPVFYPDFHNRGWRCSMLKRAIFIPESEAHRLVWEAVVTDWQNPVPKLDPQIHPRVVVQFSASFLPPPKRLHGWATFFTGMPIGYTYHIRRSKPFETRRDYGDLRSQVEHFDYITRVA